MCLNEKLEIEFHLTIHGDVFEMWQESAFLIPGANIMTRLLRQWYL